MLERIFTFTKAQLSAFAGGAVDYFVMIFFTEVFHVHYTISIAIGGVVGAMVNFSINNKWTFRSKDKEYKHSFFVQLFRFVLVVINSIILKSSGTYLITQYLNIDYKISRLIVDLIVSVLINYTLQRFWVFGKKTQSNQDFKQK